MDNEYTIKDTGHSFRVSVGSYGVMEIFYEHERVQTPVKKDKAEEWANHFKTLVSSEYPFSELDMEDYKSTGFGNLMEMLLADDDDECDSDSCSCDDDESHEINGRDLMKLMMMKALLD